MKSAESGNVNKRSKRLSLSQEALQQRLLQELQKSGSTLTAAAAVKLVKASGETTNAAAVNQAFDLLVSQGRLHRHPGATARSAPSYGLQSPMKFVVEGVEKALELGTEHSLASLRGSAPKAYAGLVDEEIGRLVREGKLFQLPGTPKSPKFTTRSPMEVVVRAIDSALQSGDEHSLTSLRGAVPKDYKPLVDEEVARRLREGRLFQVPGTAKKPKYTTQSLRPTSLLTAAHRKSLETILGKVNPLRSRSLELGELLEFLDGVATPAPQSSRSSSAAAPTLDARPVANSRALSLDWLLELYREDLPSRGGLTSMPIPWTWRRYAEAMRAQGAAPDKAAFDQVLLQGSSRGLLEITPHERPSALSADDAAAAIREPDGGLLFFWRPVKVRG